MNSCDVCVWAFPNFPLVQTGDDLAHLIIEASQHHDGLAMQSGDVVTIAQKIVSKAENAVVDLASVSPSESALTLAERTGRDPRLCQVYLDESAEVLGTSGRQVVTIHRLGFECTGAGVDQSNISSDGRDIVTLLPRDPDESARRIRNKIRTVLGIDVAVVVTDSFGKADRQGSIGVSIGFAGIAAVEKRSQHDLFGNRRARGSRWLTSWPRPLL